MMREGSAVDKNVVEAIHRIRGKCEADFLHSNIVLRVEREGGIATRADVQRHIEGLNLDRLQNCLYLQLAASGQHEAAGRHSDGLLAQQHPLAISLSSGSLHPSIPSLEEIKPFPLTYR